MEKVEGNKNIYVNCEYCGKEFLININSEDLFKWQNGSFIQDVFDYLTPSERELIISGTCNDCFDKLYKEENL